MVRCFHLLNKPKRFTAATFLLLCIVGCNKGPTMAPVTGDVELMGKPLPGGRIIFEPIDKSSGAKSAIGDIAEDGTFELFTVEPGDGVIVGKYYPVVMDPKEDDDGESSGRNSKRKKIGIVDLTKTQLEVKAPGPNNFTIEITKEYVKYGVRDD